MESLENEHLRHRVLTIKEKAVSGNHPSEAEHSSPSLVPIFMRQQTIVEVVVRVVGSVDSEKACLTTLPTTQRDKVDTL